WSSGCFSTSPKFRSTSRGGDHSYDDAQVVQPARVPREPYSTKPRALHAYFIDLFSLSRRLRHCRRCGLSILELPNARGTERRARSSYALRTRENRLLA